MSDKREADVGTDDLEEVAFRSDHGARAQVKIITIPTQESGVTEPRAGRLDQLLHEPFRRDSLVGSYFHSRTDDGNIDWMGAVVADVAPGYVLVETFVWGAQGSHSQRVVAVSDMADWTFYDTDDWMEQAYEEHSAKRKVQEGRA